ncbi:transcription initiation factor TFIID subunit 4b-like isoform X2 [Olea europaea var. sylvestris]|uniref:transcription initiation factor TFIID subunit 4b-like isoform X2 n=1 Tax=Olea europaea var. sylvestris TaxID=158386 RepID=UPI000C1D07F2|nr:transcription initiation factor TFIID subunit 4b-like isoform X2 [Olea europaea var. sylvestris]
MERSAKRQLDQKCVTRKKQKSRHEPQQNTDSNDEIAIARIRVEVEEKVMFSSGEQSRALSQEETTILQKNALQRKLENIMSRCGIKSRTEDVEQCLSLCVEVRLHGLISNLIKLSKKKRSLMLSTAEVQHCVIISNQELWKKMITRDKEVKIKNL